MKVWLCKDVSKITEDPLDKSVHSEFKFRSVKPEDRTANEEYFGENLGITWGLPGWIFPDLRLINPI